MREFVYLLTPYLGCILLFYFVRQILPGKVRLWHMPLYLIPVVLIHVPKLFWGSASFEAQTISLVGALLIYTIYPILFFREAIWKRIVISVFFLMIQAISDTACYTFFAAVIEASSVTVEEYTLSQLVCYTAASTTIFALLGSCCVLLFRSVSMRKFQPYYIVFLVFPLSQFMLLFYSLYPDYNSLWLLGSVLLGLGAEVALLGYTISHEKKIALEQELQETRHTMALERMHYQTVEERREKLSEIRRGFNEQLAEIGQMVRRGEDAGAQMKIQNLAEDIRQTRETPYCAIPVVNAVLTEKLRECQTAGVSLKVELNIPSNLHVEPLHLCSVFSNLLDNAIKGAGESGVEVPVIGLTSAMKGDYLFIKTVNPSKPPKKYSRPGHGYGIQILRSMASQYNGEYLSVFENGTYTAIVTLLVNTIK